MAAPVNITFLGGLGEIGRNCAALETNGQIVLLDCGQMFAGAELPGVDAVLPNFDWIIERADQLAAMICTHAHEDHIGAVPYLLSALCPMSLTIYGSPLTLGILEHKLLEAGVYDQADLRVINDHDQHRIGPFDCEFLPVTHSIPSGNITAFHTPQGVILHSSDFKLDLTPIDGRRTDLSRIGALAHNPGIRLMLADSTNADLPGASKSEKEIGSVLTELMRNNAHRRVIVACFASHIHRLQQVADAARATDRVLVPVGLSMLRNVKLARDLKLLQVADNYIADAEELDRIDPRRTCVVCTGSQGEYRAALGQMARGENRWLTLGENDTVIFSAHPIPGNEATIGALRNQLARRRVKVIHSGQLDVHTSGHGKQEELKTLHSLAVPEFFVPVHGEYSHLVAHHDLALQMGMAPKNVLLAEDGDQLTLADKGLRKVDSVGGSYLYVDGSVGETDDTVLSDRRKLGNNGFLMVVFVVDLAEYSIIAGPRLVAQGWVASSAITKYQSVVVTAVKKVAQKAMTQRLRDPQQIAQMVRRAAGKTVWEQTKRRPVIVPVVLVHND